jgi:hypothetical protein
MKPLLLLGGLLLTRFAGCTSTDTVSHSSSAPQAVAAPTSAHPVPDAPHLPATKQDTVALLSRALWPDGRGYRLESFRKGDINQDLRPDFIAVFRTQAPTDTLNGEASYSRRVALILNRGWPTVALAAYNDTVVECTACGGDGVGDPHQGITIKGGYFSLESLYGACQKTYVVTTFRYSQAEHNWFLHKIGQDDDDCNNMDVPARHKEQTVRDFGHVSFEEFEGGAPPQTL